MQWLSNGSISHSINKVGPIPCGCYRFFITVSTTPRYCQLFAFTKLAQPRFGEFCALIYPSGYPQYHILLPPDLLIMPAMCPQRIFLLKTECTVPLENLQRLIETLWLSSCFISRPAALCWLFCVKHNSCHNNEMWEHGGCWSKSLKRIECHRNVTASFS